MKINNVEIASQSATFVIAASDSLHKERADYVCDGVGDQVEIQAAINALSIPGGSYEGGGGKILLLDGTYSISSPININKKLTTIEGLGWGTVLSLSANCNVINITGNGYVYPRFNHFSIQGGDNTGHGIYANSTTEVADLYIQKLLIAHLDGDGIHLENSGWHHLISNNTIESVNTAIYETNTDGTFNTFLISKNDIKLNSVNGIVITGSSGNMFERCVIDGNLMKNGIDLDYGERIIISNNNLYCSETGIKLNHCTYPLVSGNHSRLSDVNGIEMTNGSFGRIIGNHVYKSEEHGIYCDHQKVVIANNAVLSSSQKLHETYNEIEIVDDNGIITNNQIYKSSTAPRSLYGLHFGSGASNCLCINNQFTNGASLSNESTTTVIKDNIGYPTKNADSSTGTGAQQTIPHTLADTPTKVMVWNIEDGANPYQSAVADGTNIYITAVINQDYGWEAEVI